jgi:hypothetical protein
MLVALAIRAICRTCGAWRLDMPCTQPFRAGLRSSAPPALRYNLQFTNYESPITGHELPLADPKLAVPKPKRRAMFAIFRLLSEGRVSTRPLGRPEKEGLQPLKALPLWLRLAGRCAPSKAPW